MADPLPLAVLIPAAGSARRMRGRDKLLEPVGGRPLLARQAAAALSCGGPVLVTLPPDRPGRAAALAGLGVDLVTVADAAEGMAASIRAGVAALAGRAGAVMVLPADMPELTAGDLRAMAEAWAARPGSVLRATAADGRPGHPVVFPARLFPALLRLAGDRGARGVLAAEDVFPVALPGEHALTDLDTPEDWAAWRARNQA